MPGYYVEQDNPGGGNCGFYAFANALIPHLQQELSTHDQERPCWEKLRALFDQGEDVDTIERQIRDYDLKLPNEALLRSLNGVLRRCLVNTQMNDTGGILPIRNQVIEFLGSSDVAAAHQNIVRLATGNLLISDASESENQVLEQQPLPSGTPNEIVNARNAFVICKVLGIEVNTSNNTIVAEDVNTSRLISAVNLKATTAAASSEDLGALAGYFGLELRIIQAGNTMARFEPKTLYLKHGSSHWTTLINPFPLLREDVPISRITQRLAEKHMRGSELTVAEIKRVFESYLGIGSPFGGFFTRVGRHHTRDAQDIINACNDPNATVESLVAHLATFNRGEYNPEGDFYARLNYVMLRYSGKSYTLRPAPDSDQQLRCE